MLFVKIGLKYAVAQGAEDGPRCTFCQSFDSQGTLTPHFALSVGRVAGGEHVGCFRVWSRCSVGFSRAPDQFGVCVLSRREGKLCDAGLIPGKLDMDWRHLWLRYCVSERSIYVGLPKIFHN